MATRPRVRVRTGCGTCKLRKIKCDEARPFCRRCTSCGHKCDGYSDSTDALRSLARPRKDSRTAGQLFSCFDVDRPLSAGLTPEERQWLGHFSCETGPALSGDPEHRVFWSVRLPQLSVLEPAIKNALLAVSSCHARLQTHYSGCVGQELTIKHYSLAISQLYQKSHPKSTEPQVHLICCLLFICLECLLGNTGLALTHLRHGLKILESCHSYNNNNALLPKSVIRSLEPIYENFKAQSTVFGIPSSFSARVSEPMDFTDSSGAKSKLDMLITDCMAFVKHMRINYGEPHIDDDDPKRSLQKTLLDQLLAWKAQMQFLERSLPPSTDPVRLSTLMLHIRQQGTFIYVAICLDPLQTYCDKFSSRFESLVNVIECFMAYSKDHTGLAGRSLSFSLESSIIPSLWLTAIKCRDSVIRRRAIRLLEMHPGREGLWDARLYEQAAKRLVEIEEIGILRLGQNSSQYPDECHRVYLTDVHRITEDPVRSARLVFHIAPNSYFGEMVIWSEDITF